MGTSPPESGSGRPLVILVHGLARTRLSMRHLARALTAAGFRTHIWHYYSRLYRLEDHVAHFRDHLENLGESAGPIHFVGHSLGGLAIRGATSEPGPFQLGRIVMIAPPNQGAGVAGEFGGTWVARMFYGKPVRDLMQGAPPLTWLGLPATECGIIAGSRQFHILNPISYIHAWQGLEHEHDGTVEIESTKLPGMKDFIIVTAHHTFICNHPQTIVQTIAFLKTGRFAGVE